MTGFDETILALYSRGMSTRDIEAHLRELYGVSVGRDLISRVTDGVMGDFARVAPEAVGGFIRTSLRYIPGDRLSD